MKMVKSKVSTMAIAVLLLVAQIGFAQDAPQGKAPKGGGKKEKQSEMSNTSATKSAEIAPVPDYSTMSKDEIKKDVDSRMAKFNEMYDKMKKKEASTNDPEMKADLNKMLAQMDKVKSDISQLDSAPEAQQAKAKQQLKGDIDKLKQMQSEMKSKYAGQKGEGAAGSAEDRQKKQAQQTKSEQK